jgi:hypothetical protein
MENCGSVLNNKIKMTKRQNLLIDSQVLKALTN